MRARGPGFRGSTSSGTKLATSRFSEARFAARNRTRMPRREQAPYGASGASSVKIQPIKTSRSIDQSATQAKEHNPSGQPLLQCVVTSRHGPLRLALRYPVPQGRRPRERRRRPARAVCEHPPPFCLTDIFIATAPFAGYDLAMTHADSTPASAGRSGTAWSSSGRP